MHLLLGLFLLVVIASSSSSPHFPSLSISSSQPSPCEVTQQRISNHSNCLHIVLHIKRNRNEEDKTNADTKGESDFSNFDLGQYLEGISEFHTSIRFVTVKFGMDLSLELRGEIIDAFLTPRPWWNVWKEELGQDLLQKDHTFPSLLSPTRRSLKSSLFDVLPGRNLTRNTTKTKQLRSQSVLPRRLSDDLEHVVDLVHMPRIDEPLKIIASFQFPKSCDNKHVLVKRLRDFNEYGNEAGNVANAFRGNMGNVFIEYVDYGAHWINKKTECPHVGNQFLCSFLAMGNCMEYITLPKEMEALHFFKIQSPAANDTTLTLSKHEYDLSKTRTAFPSLYTQGESYWLHQQLNFSKIVKTSFRFDQSAHLTYVGIMFRKNYFYRLKVAQFLKKYRDSLKSFDANEKCIGFHIRRGDRVNNEKNPVEYCKWIEEQCPGKSRNDKIGCMQSKYKYANLGCHTAVPYGALTFEDFMTAARYMKTNKRGQDDELSDVKTIVVVTNDHDWAKNHSVEYEDEWNFQILPQPAHHRISGLEHGVNVQGSIQSIQQCSGMVGHFSSAFTQFLYYSMCFRHGPQDSEVFGKCPIKFDFGELK